MNKVLEALAVMDITPADIGYTMGVLESHEPRKPRCSECTAVLFSKESRDGYVCITCIEGGKKTKFDKWPTQKES